MRLIILLLSAIQAFAAIPAGMQWGVRAGGTNLNGCGFYPTPGTGTNYAIQDAAQVAIDGAVITASAGAASATVTLAGYTVTADDVNNTVKVASGTNAVTGTFHISSVNVGANTWTMDRNITSGASSDMVAKMGGACATWDGPIQGTNASYTSGGIVNVEDGTYTITSTITLASGPVSIVFRGYQTAWGDYGARPTITSATNSVQLFTLNNGLQTIVFDFVEMTHTAGTRGNAIGTTGGFWVPNVVIKRALFSGFNVAIIATSDPRIRNLHIENTKISNTVSHGISLGGIGNLALIDSWIDSPGGSGVVQDVGDGSPYSFTCLRSAVSGAGTSGFALTVSNGSALVSFDKCVAIDNASTGITITQGTSQSSSIKNSVIFGNGGVGLSYVSTGVSLQNTDRQSNAYGDNTGGDIAEAATPVALASTEITITVDPFTDYANGDFSLNSTAGGGADLKTTGWPGTITLGAGAGVDIGPLQSAGGAGSTPSAAAYVQ